MTDIEAQILLNQSSIMAALCKIPNIRATMSDELMERYRETGVVLKEHGVRGALRPTRLSPLTKGN